MQETHEAILQVRNLHVCIAAEGSKKYAVKDVSFDVRPQEIVCLVGESGSGKSVTASSLMRLLPGEALSIDSGSILLEGEEITRANAERLRALRGNRIAMVFQEPLTALNPVMRVGDQIAEVLRIHKPQMSDVDIAKRVQALMVDVQLPDPVAMAQAFPFQLSGGQRQRIVIAMALALEPALIIADEPTTALDVTTQAQILRLFKELLDRHRSGVLMITHDLGVVADVADQVIVMRNGELVEQGLPGKILRAPEHPYTQMLLAAVPKLLSRSIQENKADPLLDVQGLRLSYPARPGATSKARTVALDSLSLTLGPGEVVGVVGESGSGKSTLARALLRFEEAEGGTVRFEGMSVLEASRAELARYRKRVQMIFQDPYKSLNPRRTVGQSIIEGPVQYGASVKQASEAAGELMRLVGLDPSVLNRYPHEFSGGQRQRICIARALAMEPALIIADEAVSALDVSVQAQVLDLFESLRKKLNFSMLFITHDLRVASNICDSIIVMRKGQIVEQGPGAQLFANPQHAYTKALLDSVPGHALA
ncbi:MAG TPA: ABC transporter ATP-binding protein [Burkholderiaceae bacterium]|nr:ABC transporter ATP-binding protein [Burkholderiaceae bacterium]